MSNFAGLSTARAHCRPRRHRPPEIVRNRLLLAAACAALALAPAAHAQAAPASAGAVVQPGDSLRITVFRRPEFSGQFAVAADGSITHPLYREINVAGLGQAEIESRMRTFLTRFGENPQFVVEPMLRVAVGGEVRNPRLYSLPAAVTVAEAVALAGGPTDRGDLVRTQLLRGSEVLTVDLTHPQAGVAASGIHSGDQILVARRPAPARELIAPIASVMAVIVGILNVVLK